jgi:hypothetical protein
MTKEKYNKIVNSQLTVRGKVLSVSLIILVIALPIFLFPLTGVVIYDILLSIGIIVMTITVIGIATLLILKVFIWDNHRKGYHELDLDYICLDMLNTLFNGVSFVLLYFGGDWR